MCACKSAKRKVKKGNSFTVPATIRVASQKAHSGRPLGSCSAAYPLMYQIAWAKFPSKSSSTGARAAEIRARRSRCPLTPDVSPPSQPPPAGGRSRLPPPTGEGWGGGIAGCVASSDSFSGGEGSSGTLTPGPSPSRGEGRSCTGAGSTPPLPLRERGLGGEGGVVDRPSRLYTAPHAPRAVRPKSVATARL